MAARLTASPPVIGTPFSQLKCGQGQNYLTDFSRRSEWPTGGSKGHMAAAAQSFSLR